MPPWEEEHDCSEGELSRGLSCPHLAKDAGCGSETGGWPLAGVGSCAHHHRQARLSLGCGSEREVTPARNRSGPRCCCTGAFSQQFRFGSGSLHASIVGDVPSTPLTVADECGERTSSSRPWPNSWEQQPQHLVEDRGQSRLLRWSHGAESSPFEHNRLSSRSERQRSSGSLSQADRRRRSASSFLRLNELRRLTPYRPRAGFRARP